MLNNIVNAIAGQEWIFIIIIGIIFIFGAKKIPEIAKTFGKAKSEYEKGKIEGERDLDEYKNKEKKSN
jgi:sec-independent protein translocase protein TatA